MYKLKYMSLMIITSKVSLIVSENFYVSKHILPNSINYNVSRKIILYIKFFFFFKVKGK